MYPAGQVFWILPVAPQKKTDEQTDEADWWKKLQEWGKETLQKSKSMVQMSGPEFASGSPDENLGGGRDDCAAIVGKSIRRDLEWMDKWFKHQAAKVIISIVCVQYNRLAD